MTNVHAQVVIIGAGIIGTSIAYHLAIRGCTDIVLLEKEPTEISGTTARSIAGVRHEFSHEINVRLSRYSIERLRHFDEEVGGHAELRPIGYLFLINTPDVWEDYRRAAAMQRGLGVRVEELRPDEVVRCNPYARTDDLVGAIFGADDGYCDAHGVALGYLNRARALGARLLRATPAIGLRVVGDRVVAVETPDQVIACEVVINAAGPWAGEVAALAGLVVPVRPYRRCVYVTEPFPLIGAPLPLTIDVGSGFYMRQEQANLLLGMSNLNEPSSHNVLIDWEWLNTLLEAGLARFPMLERVGLAERLCWAGSYEVTPDHQPILGRHPALPNYIDASGFSGHGVMHAPATGMLIAEEVLDQRAHTIAIDALRITRFLNQAPGHEQNIY